MNSPKWKDLEDEAKDTVNEHFRKATIEFAEAALIRPAIARREKLGMRSADQEGDDEHIHVPDPQDTGELILCPHGEDLF